MQSQQAVNPQNIAMAEQELEMVTDLFNRYEIAQQSLLACHTNERLLFVQHCRLVLCKVRF